MSSKICNRSKKDKDKAESAIRLAKRNNEKEVTLETLPDCTIF